MSSCDESNISKNYIVQSPTDFDILSACTGFYTNNIYNCTGDTLTLHSTTVSANTINSTVYLSGGTNLLDIFGSMDTNTFVTGFTYDNSNNLNIQRNDGVSFGVNISEFSGLTINGVLSACTGIYTSNLYGCSPITVNDDLILLNKLTLSAVTQDDTLTQILARNNSTGEVKYRDVSSIAPAAKLQNTYFVSSLSGDNSTALVGDINNPWKTITEARNQAVADGFSNSLIHVYSGEYLEDEIQYENGNFYFEPNSKVTTQRTASGGTTSIFKLGESLVYESNAYSANTCNVYGYGDFSVSATTDTDAFGGFILSMLGDSNSYFEFNDAYVHSGEAFYAGGNSILTLEGHDILLDPSGSDGLDFGDSSTTLINVNNIVGGGSHFNIHYRTSFAGKSVVNFNKLIGSDQLVGFDQFMQPTAEITMNFNLIEHTGGSQFIINSGNNQGGTITLNGDFYAPYGNGILSFNDYGEYNINGNITCRDTALLSIDALPPGPFTNFVLNYNGDIITSGITSDFGSNGGIQLNKITANLNGSLTNLSLGDLSNGINIDGDSILSIDNFDINVASGNTIGTSSSNVVNIKHSLSINKPFSSGITTTGLYNYTGTTNVGDLVIYNTPTNDNSLTQILGRNSTTGDVEYRDVSSIIPEGKLQNTYFVSSLSGDNSTALLGDVNKPFKTITGARNQAVADGYSNSLIYVYPGDYTDYEVQYENGNFYFEPNANVTLSGSTSIFRLGTNLNIADSIYTGNTCNVFGYGNFIVPPSVPGGGVNTMGLNAGLSPESYFECNSVEIDNGVGFFLANDSKITLKCDLIKRNTGPGTTGCIRISDDSEGYIDIRKIEGGTGSPAVECRWTVGSTFNGKALINIDEIETTSGCIPVLIVNANDGSEVILNSNKLTHTSSGSSSDYLLYNERQRGGTVTINANLENEGSGILYGGLGSDGGLFEFNGNIRTKYTAINHILTDTSTDIEIKYNGDIVVDGDATSAIVMNGSTLHLNGSLKDLNTTGTTNGVTINGTTDLKIVNFDIDVNTESIVSSVPNEIEIIHSLNVDKPLNSNITTTGLFNYTGTTNVGDLVIYNTPTNDDSLTQILGRNSTNGDIEYRDVSSIIGAASADTFVTGFTYDNANTFTISDNSGSTFNATINTVTGLTSTGDVEVIGNLTVTGGSGNIFTKQVYVEGNLGLDFASSSVTLGNLVDGTIINGSSLIVNGDTTINGNLSATTISATTYFGDGSNLTGIPHTTDTFVSGGTYNDITDIITFTNTTGGTFDVTGITDTFVTGFTWNPTTFDLTIEQNNGVIDETVNLSVLASDVYVLSGTYNPATGIVTYTNSTGGTFQVSGFTTGMTDSYTTDAYLSGDEIRFDNNIQGINFYNVDLTPVLSGKTNVTLFNSYTSDTQTVLDSKVSGATNLSSTGIFAQKNGENLEFKGLTSTGGTVTITNDSTIVNVEIPLDTNTFVTGFTYDDINTFTITRNDGTAFTQTINVLSATTISGGTLYGDGSNLTGISTQDTFVTGGTYSDSTDIITFTNTTGGTFNVTGITDKFVTGGTYNPGTVNLDFSGNSGFSPFSIDVSALKDDTNTFVTGFTYDNINTFTISDNSGSTFNASINVLSATTISGGTLYGDGSNLTGISTENTTITGFTYDDSNTFTISDSSGSTFDASINIMTGLTINGESTGTTLTVNGQSVFSGTSTDVVQIYGSGTTTPIFRVQGSSGELFSITDSLVGELFAVNDISGIPILQVYSDNRIILGDNVAPSLYTTAKVTATSGSLTSIYSIPLSAYTGAWFEYTAKGTTSLRAGNIASIFSGTSVNHNETTTTDIGDTSDLLLDVIISGTNATLTASATTSNWEIKTIIRSI